MQHADSGCRRFTGLHLELIQGCKHAQDVAVQCLNPPMDGFSPDVDVAGCCCVLSCFRRGIMEKKMEATI